MLATFTNRGREIQIGRTPKGGIDFGDKFYRGGQFCPVAALPIAGGALEEEAHATRGEVASAIAERLDEAGYDARSWVKDGIARVYVKRHEYLGRKGRKTTDYGFIEIRSRISFGTLTRMAGTIEGLCDGITFHAAPETRTPSQSFPHPDALDQLEAEADRGPAVEGPQFG